MELIDKAVEVLMENYEKALKRNDVRKKVTWALYQTWKFADAFEDDRGDLEDD